jgi:hypothetical protein
MSGGGGGIQLEPVDKLNELERILLEERDQIEVRQREIAFRLQRIDQLRDELSDGDAAQRQAG